MSNGGLTVVDGKHLVAVTLSVPELEGTVTGAQLLELAESRASSSLFGISLPESLKSSAFKRLNYGDAVSFQSRELDRDQGSSFVKEYISAIADELKDDPLAIAILNGNTLRLFLEDEDDFAMLAENLFTDLDIEDKGKISKNQIQNALVHMGVELGIPPFSEFPLLNNILQKHGAEGGEQELGQSQFAQLLQPVLQDVADALSERPVVIINKNIKIINGSRIRNQEKTSKEDGQQITTDVIRFFFEENEKELGLPSSSKAADESVVLLYDTVFSDVRITKNGVGLEEDNLRLILKEILEEFVHQLEANPVLQQVDG